jgi:hypothetical protein
VNTSLHDLLLFSVATARDWSIIFLAIVNMVYLIILIVMVLVLGVLTRMLLKKTIVIVDENVKPTLDSVRGTVVNVKGTTEYASEAAVKPIVRAYGVVAGVRRFASVIAGLTGDRSGRQ